MHRELSSALQDLLIFGRIRLVGEGIGFGIFQLLCLLCCCLSGDHATERSVVLVSTFIQVSKVWVITHAKLFDLRERESLKNFQMCKFGLKEKKMRITSPFQVTQCLIDETRSM